MGGVSLRPEAVRRQLGPLIVLVNGGFFKCRGRCRATGGAALGVGRAHPAPASPELVDHNLVPARPHLTARSAKLKGKTSPDPRGPTRPRSRFLGSEWCVLVVFSVADSVLWHPQPKAPFSPCKRYCWGSGERKVNSLARAGWRL